MYPLKLNPIYIKTVWGNTYLASLRHENQIIGSSWEISAHPHADNTVINGKYKGQTLSALIDQYPREMLGEKKKNQMLRLSYIDASQSLSIQVHPYNEYARQYENDEGKVEAWYILKSHPDAQLISGTTTEDIDVIKKAVKEDKIEDYVNKVKMAEGDFITIDAGQLHAFGAGMLGLEISQNSDVTYRFYDFHRKDDSGKERPLHIQKSFDVVDLTKHGEKSSHPFVRQGKETVVDRKEFTVEIIDLDGEYLLEPNQERFYCLTNVLDNCELIYENQVYPFHYTENIFIPAYCSPITIKGKTRIIISYVK